MTGRGEMGLIQLCFKAGCTATYHTIPQATFILLQLIVYNGHQPTKGWCKYRMAEFSFKYPQKIIEA